VKARAKRSRQAAGCSAHSSPRHDALTFAKTKVSSLAGDRGVAKKKILTFRIEAQKTKRELRNLSQHPGKLQADPPIAALVMMP
jgi:hypothetical protein